MSAKSTNSSSRSTLIQQHLRTAEPLSSEPHCSICLEEWSKSEHIVSLACNHIFHETCIVEWLHLKGHNKCPFCRQILFPENSTSRYSPWQLWALHYTGNIYFETMSQLRDDLQASTMPDRYVVFARLLADRGLATFSHRPNTSPLSGFGVLVILLSQFGREFRLEMNAAQWEELNQYRGRRYQEWMDRGDIREEEMEFARLFGDDVINININTSTVMAFEWVTGIVEKYRRLANLVLRGWYL